MKKAFLVVGVIASMWESSYAQELQLHRGWNFIGFNYQFESNATANIGYYEIRNVTAFGYVEDPFEGGYILQPLTVTSFQPGQGYWVEVENDTTINISTTDELVVPELYPGYNMVSIDSQGQNYREWGLEHGYRIRNVTAFGYVEDPFEGGYILQPLTVTSFQPGQGYWVEVERLDRFVLRKLTVSGREASVENNVLTVHLTDEEFSNNKTLEISVYPPYVNGCEEFDNVTITLSVNDTLSSRSASLRLFGVNLEVCRDESNKKIEISNIEVPVGAILYINGTDSTGSQINPVELINNSADSVLNSAISRCNGEDNCFSYNLQLVENKLENELGISNPLHQVSYPGNYTFTIDFDGIPLDEIQGNIYVSEFE
ncbi:hypothetical protein [Desulfurobacterium crinifex]